MMNKLIVPFLALVVAGCMTKPEGFLTSSVPVTQGQYTVLAEEVQGTANQVEWLFFTFGKAGSVQRHALEDALSQVDGADGLVAMSIDSETFSMMPISLTLIPFPLLPTFYTVYVTGTPVKLVGE